MDLQQAEKWIRRHWGVISVVIAGLLLVLLLYYCYQITLVGIDPCAYCETSTGSNCIQLEPYLV